MNSCRSIELSACMPPLITFSIGTGSVAAPAPPRCRKSLTPGGRGPRRSRSSPLLGAVEVGVLPLERQLAPILPHLGCELLGDFDPAPEPLCRPPQLELGIHVEPARDVDGGEEHVA